MLPESKDPLHERLADAVEQLIASGQFGRGARLPTHRQISASANVAIGTVTKAIDLLERRGVVRSETGRGTFVNLPPEIENAPVDLNFNVPLPAVSEDEFRTAATVASGRLGNVPNGGYPEPGGGSEQRAVIADWLATTRLKVDPANLVVTVGGQHAIHLAFADLLGRTRIIATEAATFSGAIAAAANLGLTLQAVDHDEQGMIPSSLQSALRDTGCKAIYLTPVCQNPFGYEMGTKRRQEIIEVCRRADASIVEDDIYSIYGQAKIRPFAEIAPERVYYINGLSKSLTPLVRVGGLIPPSGRRAAVISRVRAELWGTSPFDMEVARALLQADIHLKARDLLLAEAKVRVELARRILNLADVPMPQGAPHIWLPMGAGQAEKFARLALEKGVRVTPPDATAVGGDKAGGVRLCLMAPSERASLERALHLLAELRDVSATQIV
jgi:DNA-binding transcriptional MocR family regulator